MAETARHLQDSHDDMQATFQSAVEVSQSHVDGCDAVGLTFVTRKRHVTTVAVTDHDLLGALNLYSKSRDASDDPAFVEGLVIAAHVSIAVAAARQVDNLNQGMASRTVIGQATGILMERYDLDAARAFTLMTRMSSQGNIKLRNLAQQIVDNRAKSVARSRRPS